METGIGVVLANPGENSKIVTGKIYKRKSATYYEAEYCIIQERIEIAMIIV